MICGKMVVHSPHPDVQSTVAYFGIQELLPQGEKSDWITKLGKVIRIELQKKKLTHPFSLAHVCLFPFAKLSHKR